MNTTFPTISQDLRSSWQIWEHSSQVVSTKTWRRLSLVTSHFWLSWKHVMLGSASAAWRIMQRRKKVIFRRWTQTETAPDWCPSQKIRLFTSVCNVHHKDTAKSQGSNNFWPPVCLCKRNGMTIWTNILKLYCRISIHQNDFLCSYGSESQILQDSVAVSAFVLYLYCHSGNTVRWNQEISRNTFQLSQPMYGQVAKLICFLFWHWHWLSFTPQICQRHWFFAFVYCLILGQFHRTKQGFIDPVLRVLNKFDKYSFRWQDTEKRNQAASGYKS